MLVSQLKMIDPHPLGAEARPLLVVGLKNAALTMDSGEERTELEKVIERLEAGESAMTALHSDDDGVYMQLLVGTDRFIQFGIKTSGENEGHMSFAFAAVEAGPMMAGTPAPTTTVQ